MNLRVKAQTAKTITLEWDRVPGAEGYLFFKDGVRVSRTFDPSKTSIRFSKPGSYRVEAVVFTAIDQGLYPPSAPPPPPPPPAQVAPRTYNSVAGGEPGARFCVQGLPRNSRGLLYDEFTAYDDDGKDVDGGRTTLTQVPGLKQADMMDQNGPCDPYEWQGQQFPPWPAGSYQR